MSSKKTEDVRLNVTLKGEAAERFERIKRFLTLETDTELIRTLISDYYRKNEKDLTSPPKTMWHLNLDSAGVLIWDPDIKKGIHITFTPKGICCDLDERDDCRHIQFALSQEDIQDVIREHRKAGWKLPDV